LALLAPWAQAHAQAAMQDGMDAGPLVDAAAPVRWIGYLSLFPIAGALVFSVVARRRLGESHPDLAAALVERARVAGLVAAMVLIPSLALKLYLQVRSFSLPGDPLTWSSAQPILTSTSWGHGWEWQAGAALLAIAGLLAAGRSTAGWLMTGLAVAALVWTLPLTGHAIENPWGTVAGVGLQGLHVAGGALWLGTLAVMMAATYPQIRGRPDREQVLARLVHSYSPLALTGAGTAVLAGVLLAWNDVASWSALIDSTYGRALLIKLAVLSGVIALGYHNWRRVRPALGAVPGAARLARSASVELAIGTILLAVTAVLVALPAPGLN
jgi:copper transport protein